MNSQLESRNDVRPEHWDDIVGQDDAKRLLSMMVETAKRRSRPLDHVLLVGPSGTGKTTFAVVIANEMGTDAYQLAAPISQEKLVELSGTMKDGDVLFIDEIHQQAIQERRGKSAATQPEVLFGLMEDFLLATEHGMVPFPRITLIGATTDEGMLPDAFLNRFPIRPVLVPYTEAEMETIARNAADKLFIHLRPEAAQMFARAGAGVPRVAINYVRNAAMLTDTVVKEELAFTVVHDLNGTTDDGLTRDQQSMLLFLYEKGRRVSRQGDVTYQASVSTIATGIGKSRDQKAVQLRVEPALIARGYTQVLHGGRALTDAGVLRAAQLQRGA